MQEVKAEKISIITATYNSASTLQDTINSIASQTYPNIEHIIIDGGSKDQTMKIVKANDHLITNYISEPDNGLYDAMNKGIQLATGEIIGILNSDDFYANHQVIEKVMEIIQEKGVSTVYGDLQFVDPEKTEKIIRHWQAGTFSRKKFLNGWMLPHPTFFVHRKVYEQFGHFNTSFKTSADYELMLRFLFKNKVSTYYLSEVVVKMRAGGLSNSSFRHRLFANSEDRRAWEVNNLRPRLFTTWLKPIRKIGQYKFF